VTVVLAAQYVHKFLNAEQQAFWQQTAAPTNQATLGPDYDQLSYIKEYCSARQHPLVTPCTPPFN
jgi:predicted CoA-binding protein